MIWATARQDLTPAASLLCTGSNGRIQNDKRTSAADVHRQTGSGFPRTIAKYKGQDATPKIGLPPRIIDFQGG